MTSALIFTLLLATALPTLAANGSPRLGGPSGAKSVKIVLVHGFLDTNKKMKSLAAALRAAGYQCFVPSLRPNDCRTGLRALSSALAEQIDAHFGKAQPIILVGFSMGGLITRDYVQNLAGGRGIRGVFLISTPNHGTLWASLAPWPGIRQMRPRSPFLQTLNADAAAWKDIPVFSYWTPLDLMILPASSSKWPVGKMTTIYCPLHPLMVRNRTLMADIVAETNALTAGNAPPAPHRTGSKASNPSLNTSAAVRANASTPKG